MVGSHGRNLARWAVLLALFWGSGCASTSTPGCWSDFCAKWNSCNLSSLGKCCCDGKCGGCLKCKLHAIDCKALANCHKPHYHVEPAHTRFKPTSIFTFPKVAVAPVGSEVVMLAGVCGRDGHLRADQPVEWTVAPGSVGYFMAVGRRSALGQLTSFDGGPRKLDNTFALGTTSSRYVLLTRGTPTLEDDVAVLRGQGWVSVTSPVEGTSYVTVFSPEVPEWDRRQHTSTIHWVDAQWAFPPPAVNPVGTQHVFTTTVQRASDRSPVVGWRVRYEITSGPDAGFSPDGAKVIEVPTNDLGQASAEIFQPQPAPGVNQISIQVIRPSEVSMGMGQRLVLGMGGTTKTWTAPDVAMRMTGPSQAAVGAVATYRIEVSNPGEAVVRDVVVSDQLPAGLTFQSSVPEPSGGSGARLEWRLGDLRGREARAIELNVRVDQAGIINHCATLSTAEGLNAQSCVSTTVQEGAGIDVQMYGPASVSVGQDITFEIVVTNRGTLPVSGLSISDRFDPGFAHEQAANPIERALGDLAPGETRRIGVTLRAIAAGQQCNSVDVRDASGPRATARACVNVVEGAVAPPAGAPAAGGPQPSVAVEKTGPTSVRVGEDALFDITITNNGAVAVNEIRVVDNYDPALTAVAASDKSTTVGRDLVWVIDTLPPGRRAKLQVQCRGVQPAANACNRVTVTTREGARADDDACLQVVEAAAGGGGSGLRLTITDRRDPVAVGQEGTYEIRVTNGGQAAERDVVMIATAPAEMTPIDIAGGPSGMSINGQQIIFEPVRELGPGQALTYQVRMRANRPAQVRVQAQVTSAGQAQPLLAAEETTLVAQ
ncbi:MAG: DUF11 domain-containing protein [Pirellulales bacterium]|nr:DUF11 domain-containing protein [Pirellulales bacterium]